MKRQTFSAKKEKKKLNAIISQLPDDLVKMTEGLVADACFMAEQLEKLREEITENGWSEEYQNGANQFGRKASVAGDMYLKTQKSYAAVIKQLTDLMPKQEGASAAGAELMDFIKRK